MNYEIGTDPTDLPFLLNRKLAYQRYNAVVAP